MFQRTKNATKKVQTGIERGLGLSFLTDAGHFIKDTVRSLFRLPHYEQRETFEQAMSRLNLTEADLGNMRTRYLKQCGLFLLFSAAALAYTIYLFLLPAYAAGAVAFLMTLLLVIYALRAHFWAFQIKNRKLGCTLSEWLNNKIIEEPKTGNSLQNKD